MGTHPIWFAVMLADVGSLPAASPAPAISFQGRLLDPVTVLIKADGAYDATFLLYQDPAGGTALWTETKSIDVGNGFFTTQLGGTTALDPGRFDLYAAWLGITLAGDPEMVPRHRISYVAYALAALRLADSSPSQYLRNNT